MFNRLNTAHFFTCATRMATIAAFFFAISSGLVCPSVSYSQDAQDTQGATDSESAEGIDYENMDPAELAKIIEQQRGVTFITPERGNLNVADIAIPSGFVFADARNTRQLMQFYGNIVSSQEVGLMAPEAIEDVMSSTWFVLFEFDEIGYVKDDDKDQLDADKMLDSMIEGSRQGNIRKKEMGLPTLMPIGWAIPPRYNPDTQNLEWALELRTEEGETIVNHNTRLLGRSGVMKVTLVCDPNELESTLSEVAVLLEDFAYLPGRSYAEYKSGDKIAKYGLTALVAGGTLAVAAKSGLLGKLLKPLILLLAVIGGGFAKLFKRG